ncbi:phosphatase PAP2 family protein [Bordetella petrii]|nr:phosphatase PAP2 family protein [Bordetella petrii]
MPMHSLFEALENWNVAAFELLRGSADSALVWVWAATRLAEWPVYIAAALTLWYLIRRRDGAAAIMIFVACIGARLTELAIGAYAYHPRPFAAGYGPALVAHAANNSMPSSHALFVWTLAAVIAARRQWGLAAVLAVLGLLVAWARVFVGIHWPLDMVGAAVISVWCMAWGHLAYRGWIALIRFFARLNENSTHGRAH